MYWTILSCLYCVYGFINQHNLHLSIENEFLKLEEIMNPIQKTEQSNKVEKIGSLHPTLRFYRFGNQPRLESPNEAGQLTWYPIGFSKDFGLKPQRITIRDIHYVVWKDKLQYYCLRDCCSHQGSSFSLGTTCKNTIMCPYHGYNFDGTNGHLVEIPQLHHMESHSHNINCYKVVEKGDIVYLNTIPIVNDHMRDTIDERRIFVEPEFYDKTQRVVYLHEDFEHYAKLVSVNSLDICHIGFVHTFGNHKNPNPSYSSKIIKINDVDYHYRIIYDYTAGENSLVNKIYNYNLIQVENEYVLPHSTIARVKFGEWTSTIVTHALPISKFKTRLFVKAYRNYWSYDLTNIKNQNILSPVMNAINYCGDKITENTMYNTLKEDKSIIDLIDKTDYESMHGKFSIVYDALSNHYKNNYKTMYEEGVNMI